LPDVGEDFAFHPFEFVEVFEGPAVFAHANAARFGERLAVENADLVGAVAEVEMAAVGGEAPAFAPVGELALQFEVLQPPD
jgi:hypothetical protein